MLPLRYCCLITVFGGEPGHAPSKILLSYNCVWGQVMLPLRYCCLITVFGGEPGHAPSKILLSYNCVWG